MANRITESVSRRDQAAASSLLAGGHSGGITVLGVDPGLECSGYAVIDMAQGHVCDAGLVRTTTSRPLSVRLAEIDAGMDEVLSDHPVDLVAVEDLFSHYLHPRTAILMGHARGVILLAAARHGIDVLSLPATQVKKMLTGNGHASKIQVQRAIMATMHLSAMPEPADVADALAVALCAALIQSSKVSDSERGKA